MSPDLRLNPLSAKGDVDILVAAARIARQIANFAPLKRLRSMELRPELDCNDDRDLEDYLRETSSTAFHYCGTARMGNDSMAVVDSSLRVRGVDRLRVIDASVMPTIVSGNTNAATIMIAEKGSDLLKGINNN